MRPDALTWMNYPGRYPQGRDAFWSQFRFGFDDHELAHLRHGFRDDVIMGGAPFAPPPPPEMTVGWPHAVDRGQTGLRLRVIAPREYAFGMPVTVGLQLSASKSQQVPYVLGPRPSTVDIVIRRPDATEYLFEPLVRHCRGDADITLRAGQTMRDHAFLHYGKHGFAFQEPGVYELRARYETPAGDVVLSEATRTTIRRPASQAGHDAERLLYGEDQGKLLSLVGSSARSLSQGDAMLREFSARHPDHPASAAVRIVQGTNAAREFKTIEPSGRAWVGRSRPASARALLGDVLDIDRLRRAATRAPDEPAAARAAGAELERMGAERELPPAVGLFVNSRRREIAAEIPTLS